VHLVSPTVWAWRAGRVKGIRRAVDRMLCIFPFEEDFLRRHGVPATYVGHPLADEIPLEVDRDEARAVLGLLGDAPIIALLPGSRAGEMRRLAAPFIATARRCLRSRPELRFVVPLVNARLRALFEAELQRLDPDLPVTLRRWPQPRSHRRRRCRADRLGNRDPGDAAAQAADGRGLPAPSTDLSSGQVAETGQGALCRHGQSAHRTALAPEFLQSDCRPERLAPALLAYLDDPERVAAIQAEYERIHRELRRDAAASAARAVLDLISDSTSSGRSATRIGNEHAVSNHAR
jgi:lipid-A-disaccharide synthase